MDPKEDDGRVQEDDALGWVKSLPVPSVQEMVRNDSQSVPDRYVQEFNDRPLDSEISQDLSGLPIINFSSLANGDEDERRKLDIACKKWGFFQLIDHGVTEKVLHDVKAAQAAFFELPLEEKKKYAMAENDIQGYGQVYVVSEQQKLAWGDLMILMTGPPKSRKFKNWPVSIPGFREAVEKYSTEVQKVAEELLANLSLLMGMEKEGLKALHKEIKQTMSMNYYPPCSRPELVLGINPHSDSTTITLLLQDDDITGLQIRHKHKWFPVKPIPNAVIVNIGDVMEVWSNGVYKSIEHRAVTNKKRARMSLATFMSPEVEVEIGPLESMVDEKHRPRMYRNVKYVDFIRHKQEAGKLDGKAHADFLTLEAE